MPSVVGILNNHVARCTTEKETNLWIVPFDKLAFCPLYLLKSTRANLASLSAAISDVVITRSKFMLASREITSIGSGDPQILSRRENAAREDADVGIRDSREDVDVGIRDSREDAVTTDIRLMSDAKLEFVKLMANDGRSRVMRKSSLSLIGCEKADGVVISGFSACSLSSGVCENADGICDDSVFCSHSVPSVAGEHDGGVTNFSSVDDAAADNVES